MTRPFCTHSPQRIKQYEDLDARKDEEVKILRLQNIKAETKIRELEDGLKRKVCLLRRYKISSSPGGGVLSGVPTVTSPFTVSLFRSTPTSTRHSSLSLSLSLFVFHPPLAGCCCALNRVSQEQVGPDLHFIDFEQQKLENQQLHEKIEERNEVSGAFFVGVEGCMCVCVCLCDIFYADYSLVLRLLIPSPGRSY